MRRSPNKGCVVVAVHGILTGQTDTSWPDHFQAWAWSRFRKISTLKKEYRAGPFPAWNVWFRNPRLAQGLANELREFALDGADLCFLAHSNGCDIVLKTIRILAAEGIRTRAAVFTGAAISSDVERTEILRLTGEHLLGQAWAYSSLDDCVLRLPIWPYGRLGREGFRRYGQPWESSVIRTRWFNGFGHSGYFSDNQREKTFQQAIEDCCFSRVSA